MNKKEGLIISFILQIIILPIVLFSEMTFVLLRFHRAEHFSATSYFWYSVLYLFVLVFLLVAQYYSAKKQVNLDEKHFVYKIFEPSIVLFLLFLMDNVVIYLFIIFNYANFNVYLAICTVILIIIVYFNMKWGVPL